MALSDVFPLKDGSQGGLAPWKAIPSAGCGVGSGNVFVNGRAHVNQEPCNRMAAINSTLDTWLGSPRHGLLFCRNLIIVYLGCSTCDTANDQLEPYFI